MDYDDFDDYDDYFDDDLEKEFQQLRDDIISAYANMPIERPIFSDKQVMSFEDLEVGKEYYECHLSNKTRIKLISVYWHIDEIAEFNGWRAGYIYLSNGYSSSGYLTDLGVIPYESGRWNATNYMEIT